MHNLQERAGGVWEEGMPVVSAPSRFASRVRAVIYSDEFYFVTPPFLSLAHNEIHFCQRCGRDLFRIKYYPEIPQWRAHYEVCCEKGYPIEVRPADAYYRQAPYPIEFLVAEFLLNSEKVNDLADPGT